MRERAADPETEPATDAAAEIGHAPVERRPFAFEARAGDIIRGDLWEPADAREGIALVVCHGFKGFKDWGFFPHVSRTLAAVTGWRTASFNFTGSGIGARLEEFGDLERFACNTFSRELEDLEAVLDRLAVGAAGDVEFPSAGRFGVLGHSRGGATALLKAALRRQVGALVTWAAIASIERYENMYAPDLDERGVVHILNARTGQQMPLRPHVLQDIRAHRSRLDPRSAAAHLRTPWLIVHGDADESVPVEDALVLHARSGGRARLEVIEGGGHTFGAGHPFVGPTPELERAIGLTAKHFRTSLSGA